MSIPLLHKVRQGGTTIHWFNLLISAFAHIAKKYTNKQDDLEDYISIGAIGLLKAVSV